MQTKYVKSFLSWQGSKIKLLPKLLPLFPEKINAYYEPFLGGGAVALNISARCQDLILSDKNECLINAWQCVREDPRGMQQLLIWHKAQHDRGHYRKKDFYSGHYYSMRDDYNAGRGTGPIAAARFIYLVKACFNGVWRSNRSGKINTPLGTRFYLPELDGHAVKLASAAITATDYTIIKGAGRGDVVYLDPPYYADREIASDYGVGGFSQSDRVAMVALAAKIGKRGAIVIGSDLDTPYTRELYGGAGFTYDIFPYTYCVGGTYKSRSISSELIYHNVSY
jgi:DNA adenine methylase